ncbi:glycerol-3-phosphate acyltransferase [Chloroflexota bacterium]
MNTQFMLLIIGAYLLGAVPAAYIAAKLYKGIDIRQYGSGNVGSTNLIQLTTKWMGVLVIIFDLGKGMVVVWVAKLLGMETAQQVIIGVVAIAGHNWPVFLGFNGGRGLMTTLGLAIFLPLINNLLPWGVLVFLFFGGIGLFVMHDIAFGTLLGIASLPLVSWGLGEPLALILGFLGMLLVMLIRRLTAPPSPFTGLVSRRELIVNRFFFDRDIGNRETWLSRTPQTTSQTRKRRGE